MKKILLILLLIFLSISSNFGKCDENKSISLVKTGERDWINDYNKLSKKYQTNNKVVLSTLKHFFYTGKISNECISFQALQELNEKLNVVFASVKSDTDVKNFMIGIKSAAVSNKPNTVVTEVVKKQVALKKTDSIEKSIAKPVKPNKVEGDANERLIEENNALIKDKAKLEDDSNLWFRISIGLLTLLIGSILYLNWYFSKKIEQTEELSRNALKEQSDYLNKTIKELEAKNRENKNTFREVVSPVETKTEVIIPVKEVKREQVPEPPKKPEVPRQFYLSTPAVSADGKGVFDGSEVYGATSISSLYHFVLINDKSADFTFLNTPNTVKDALTLPDRYLQPACEYTGLNSKATKIITSKTGRAAKEGNNWKVIQKAEIRFE